MWKNDEDVTSDLSVLVGKHLQQIQEIDVDKELRFLFSDGTIMRMYHEQDCCESVAIEEIVGDLKDLIGKLTMAEEVSSDDADMSKCYDSCTWTFYKFATIDGAVTIRWLGESNGYYSESVDVAIWKE